jgi:hypothetical protein
MHCDLLNWEKANSVAVGKALRRANRVTANSHAVMHSHRRFIQTLVLYLSRSVTALPSNVSRDGKQDRTNGLKLNPL